MLGSGLCPGLGKLPQMVYPEIAYHSCAHQTLSEVHFCFLSRQGTVAELQSCCYVAAGLSSAGL